MSDLKFSGPRLRMCALMKTKSSCYFLNVHNPKAFVKFLHVLYAVGHKHRIFFSKLSLNLSYPLNVSAASVDVVVTDLDMRRKRPKGSA